MSQAMRSLKVVRAKQGGSAPSPSDATVKNMLRFAVGAMPSYVSSAVTSTNPCMKKEGRRLTDAWKLERLTDSSRA
jgi:hypothetical protein